MKRNRKPHLILVMAALVLAFLLCGTAPAADDDEPDFGAFDRRLTAVEKDNADLKKRVADLEQRLARGVTVAPPAPAARSAQGHTHTCLNGHTWDHTMDGGSHTCPFCGLPQTVVDPPGRAVTAGVASGSAQSSGSFSYQYQLGASYSSGGCVGGSCPTGGRPFLSRDTGPLRRILGR